MKGRVEVRNEECLFALQRLGGKKTTTSLVHFFGINSSYWTRLRILFQSILTSILKHGLVYWEDEKFVCDSETRMSCLHVKKCKSNELSHRSYNMIINQTHTVIGTPHLPFYYGRASLSLENATKLQTYRLIKELDLHIIRHVEMFVRILIEIVA